MVQLGFLLVAEMGRAKRVICCFSGVTRKATQDSATKVAEWVPTHLATPNARDHATGGREVQAAVIGKRKGHPFGCPFLLLASVTDLDTLHLKCSF
jgi:hypothetical protein